MAGPRITEVSLSLCAYRCPTGCDPVFAAMALSLCFSRHGGSTAWLRGSSPHSAGNVSVWMCIQLSRFRCSQAPTMLLGTFWAKRFIFLITPFIFINGNFFSKMAGSFFIQLPLCYWELFGPNRWLFFRLFPPSIQMGTFSAKIWNFLPLTLQLEKNPHFTSQIIKDRLILMHRCTRNQHVWFPPPNGVKKSSIGGTIFIFLISMHGCTFRQHLLPHLPSTTFCWLFSDFAENLCSFFIPQVVADENAVFYTPWTKLFYFWARIHFQSAHWSRSSSHPLDVNFFSN